MRVTTLAFCKISFFYSNNKLCSSLSYSFYVLMFACNSNSISLFAYQRTIGIYSHVFALIIMCLLCSYSNELCASISKLAATICQSKGFKNNFTNCKRERVIAISKHEDSIFMYMNSLCWVEMFPRPYFYVESYITLLLFISYFDSYQTCVYLLQLLHHQL